MGRRSGVVSRLMSSITSTLWRRLMVFGLTVLCVGLLGKMVPSMGHTEFWYGSKTSQYPIDSGKIPMVEQSVGPWLVVRGYTTYNYHLPFCFRTVADGMGSSVHREFRQGTLGRQITTLPERHPLYQPWMLRLLNPREGEQVCSSKRLMVFGVEPTTKNI